MLAVVQYQDPQPSYFTTPTNVSSVDICGSLPLHTCRTCGSFLAVDSPLSAPAITFRQFAAVPPRGGENKTPPQGKPPALARILSHCSHQTHMAFPAFPQQQQQEELPGSWHKMDTNTRHSSAPPPQCHKQRAASTPARQPWIFHQQRRRHGRPATPRHRDSAARPATKAPLTGITTAAATPTPAGGGGADGPLSFPAPKFSAGVKVTVVAGGRFILASQATGRRWMVVGSSRKCQFGEVLRAVELSEDADDDATDRPVYFAIKVCTTTAQQ